MPGRILDVNFPEVNPSGAPPNDYEHIPTNPGMFGAFGAQAEQKLGQGVEAVGEAGLQYLNEQNQLHNQIHASELHSWFTDRSTDLVTKFSQLEGRAALDALPKFKSDLAELQKQAEGQSGNLHTKAMVANNTRRSMDWFYGIGTRHADTAFKAYTTQTAKDNIISASNVGGLAVIAQDFSKLDEQLRTIDQEGHNYLDPRGYDDKTLGVELAKYRGGAVKNWVETAATNDKDPDALTHAIQTFERYSKHIDPQSRLEIAKYLSAKQFARSADRLANYYSTPVNRTVRTDLSPEIRGLMDTINAPGAETSRGGYDELFTGKSVFEAKPGYDWSDHPRVSFRIPRGPNAGKTTSAAGRPQILASTWDEDKDRYGLTDFTPESQDTWQYKKTLELYGAAWQSPDSARGKRARAALAGIQGLTGNLEADLKTHANDPKFLDAVGHVMSGEWTSAPGGIEPTDATKTWVDRFRRNIQINRGEVPAGPDPADVVQRINNDPLFRGRPELQKAVIQNVLQKASMAQRADNLEKKKLNDQSDAAQVELFKRIHSNDATLTLKDIFDNPNLSKQAVESLTHEFEKQAGGGKVDKRISDQRQTEILQDMVSDAPKITMRDALSDDRLDMAAKHYLISRFEKASKGDPNEKELKRLFLNKAKGDITGSNEHLGLKDPKGDEQYLKFMVHTLDAYDKARSEGKTPQELLDPDSPSYLGKAIKVYKRPRGEWFDDGIHDNPPTPTPGAAQGPVDPNSLKSVDEAVAAYRAGRITKQQADTLAISRGWATRKPPPVQSVPMSQ
jgi:muramidase (phage lysozyme)